MKIGLKEEVLLFLVIVFICFNSFKPDNDLSGLKAIHIIDTFQIPQSIGDIISYSRSADIIYSKDYQIIREHSSKTTTYAKVNQSNHVSVQRTTVDSSYIYYIGKRGEKYGLQYDSLSVLNGKHKSIDSLINEFLRPPSFFLQYQKQRKGLHNCIER